MLAMAGAILGVGGAGLSAYGAYKSGRDTSNMLRYNARVAIQEGKAKEAAIKADLLQQIKENREKTAIERVALAGRGVDTAVGSPMVVATELSKQRQLAEMETLRQAGIARIAGQNQASLLKTQATNTMRSAWINVASSVIGGMGSAAMGYAAAAKPAAGAAGSAAGAAGAGPVAPAGIGVMSAGLN